MAYPQPEPLSREKTNALLDVLREARVVVAAYADANPGAGVAWPDKLARLATSVDRYDAIGTPPPPPPPVNPLAWQAEAAFHKHGSTTRLRRRNRSEEPPTAKWFDNIVETYPGAAINKWGRYSDQLTAIYQHACVLRDAGLLTIDERSSWDGGKCSWAGQVWVEWKKPPERVV